VPNLPTCKQTGDRIRSIPCWVALGLAQDCRAGMTEHALQSPALSCIKHHSNRKQSDRNHKGSRCQRSSNEGADSLPLLLDNSSNSKPHGYQIDPNTGKKRQSQDDRGSRILINPTRSTRLPNTSNQEDNKCNQYIEDCETQGCNPKPRLSVTLHCQARDFTENSTKQNFLNMNQQQPLRLRPWLQMKRLASRTGCARLPICASADIGARQTSAISCHFLTCFQEPEESLTH